MNPTKSLITTVLFAAAIGQAQFAVAQSDSKPGASDGAETVQQQAANETRTLHIATWGGAYGSAQKSAVLDPIGKSLDVEIRRTQTTRGTVPAGDVDAVELDQEALRSGCDQGALLKLNIKDLSGDETAETFSSDFVAGGIGDCGIASFAWSALFLANKANFGNNPPSTVSDVLDVKRYPGKRALIKKPENLFEFLALADGVAPGDVYTALGDRERLDKIVLRLQELLPEVVWVASPKAAIDALQSGKASMAMGFSGRAFRKTVAGGLQAIWAGHVYHYTSWAIPAKAARPDLAKAFISRAVGRDTLAAQSRLWPYGPMRKSAAEAIGRHGVLDVDLAAFIPTSAENLARGVRFDAAFWAANRARIGDRLAALLEGFPLGIRVPPPVRKPAAPAGQGDATPNNSN